MLCVFRPPQLYTSCLQFPQWVFLCTYTASCMHSAVCVCETLTSAHPHSTPSAKRSRPPEGARLPHCRGWDRDLAGADVRSIAVVSAWHGPKHTRTQPLAGKHHLHQTLGTTHKHLKDGFLDWQRCQHTVKQRKSYFIVYIGPWSTTCCLKYPLGLGSWL